MIRLTDGLVLAYTKLKTHKIRTGLVVGVAGIMFGVIAGVIMISGGVFKSVESFSSEGLNDKTIISVSRFNGVGDFNSYNHMEDPDFIKEVDSIHKARVAKKTESAKKHKIQYDAKSQDPSPITTDDYTKKQRISSDALQAQDVLKAVQNRLKATSTEFDINSFLKPYKSAHVIQAQQTIAPQDGIFSYMQKNTEKAIKTRQDQLQARFGSDESPVLQVLDKSLTKPFITTNFDVKSGNIPVIIPYSYAEKLLGLKPLKANDDAKLKLARLSEVRKKVGDIRASFCYRNNASQEILNFATNQQADIERGQKQPGYVKPKLVYEVPAKDSCGEVKVMSDTRSTYEKRQADNLIEFQKDVGEYIGTPEQHKITVQGVGISSDAPGASGAFSVANLVQDMLNSSLGYGQWTIPSDLLASVPAEYRPASIFDSKRDAIADQASFMPSIPSYLVEFKDKDEARSLLNKYLFNNGGISDEGVFVAPFGSSTLVVDEIKNITTKALNWVFLVLGIISAIILASIVGRTVAEGRRESAVFRAIGASRKDISAIYGIYTILLSLRIVIFSLVLGLVLALMVDIFLSKEATVGARLAYAATDTSKNFHLINIASIDLVWLVLTIISAGILSAIIPITLGARRNPINDMRNDT